MAAIISADDLELLTRMEAERAQRWQVIDEIQARNSDEDPEGVISAVLDTNTLVSAILVANGVPAQLLRLGIHRSSAHTNF